jgi:hypothetical protein
MADNRLELLDLTGEPSRQFTHFCKQDDGHPHSLLSLLGYNLIYFQGRVYPHKQGEGAFAPGESHPGYESVLEACAEVLEQAGQNGLPEVLAFGHVIRRTDNGFQAVSGTGSVESESLVALVRELRRQRDENLQVYLHVGMPKTATTFLQRHVFPKIPGVHYVGWDTEFFAHDFQRIKYSCPFSYIDELHNGFRQYLESFDEGKVLISDEAITGPGNRAKGIGTSVLVLKEVFPSASILLVLREQLSYLRSFYLQRLREGVNRSAVDFVRYDQKAGDFIEFDLDIFTGHIDIKFFEYKSLVSLLRSSFKEIRVVLFEQLKKEPQVFAEGLSAWLDEPIRLEGVSQTRENVKLGQLGVGIFKVFNGITAGREWVWHQSRVARFVGWVNRLDAKFHIPYDPFPPWLQAAIRQRYAATNKELGEMIGLDVERYWGKPEKAANP